MKTGIKLIAEERRRQMIQEGWTEEHDDGHDEFELSRAARVYAAPGLDIHSTPGSSWPWGKEWFSPSADPIRNLVKAGALIAAEIDRLQRHRHRLARIHGAQ